MEVSSVVFGGLLSLGSSFALYYGFQFGSIYLVSRGSYGGMKDRTKNPIGFWGAVVEWVVFLVVGLFVLAIGLFPDLRAIVRG